MGVNSFEKAATLSGVLSPSTVCCPEALCSHALFHTF